MITLSTTYTIQIQQPDGSWYDYESGEMTLAKATKLASELYGGEVATRLVKVERTVEEPEPKPAFRDSGETTTEYLARCIYGGDRHDGGVIDDTATHEARRPGRNWSNCVCDFHAKWLGQQAGWTVTPLEPHSETWSDPDTGMLRTTRYVRP